MEREKSLLEQVIKMVGRIKLSSSIFNIEKHITHEEQYRSFFDSVKLSKRQIGVELGELILDRYNAIKEEELEDYTALSVEIFACPMKDFRFYCETMLKEAPIDLLQILRPDLSITNK